MQRFWLQIVHSFPNISIPWQCLEYANDSHVQKGLILYEYIMKYWSDLKMIIGPNTTDFPVCKNRNLIRAVNSNWYQWKIRRGIYLGRISLWKVFHRFFRLYWAAGESVNSLGGIVGCVPRVIVSRPDCPSSPDASSSVYIIPPHPTLPYTSLPVFTAI